MVMYVVITNYDESGDRVAGVIVDNEAFNLQNAFPPMSTADLCGWVSRDANLVPLNFDIEGGTVVWNCGAKTRLSNNAVIILAEIRNKYKRTLGYRLLDIGTRTVGNMQTSTILERFKSVKHPYIQNGIIRNNAVNCYPNHKYPFLVVDDKVKKADRVKKAPAPASVPAPSRPKVPQEQHKPSEPEKVLTTDDFTKAQLSEIKKAQKEIGNVSVIYDPKLSPQQMRVIWVAKKKGACAEAFASPEYSVDVMKFYADRLVDLGTASECSMLLHKPDLKVEQLQELFLCILEGVPFDDLLDLSEDEIRFERYKRGKNFWSSHPISMFELEESAINYAMRLSGKSESKR